MILDCISTLDRTSEEQHTFANDASPVLPNHRQSGIGRGERGQPGELRPGLCIVAGLDILPRSTPLVMDWVNTLQCGVEDSENRA